MSFLRHRKNTRTSRTPVRIGALGVLLFALAFPHSTFANANLFVNQSACPNSFCTSASVFGVLVGPGDALKFNGDTILNDVGLKANATITTSGTNNIGSSTIADVVDFSNSLVNGNSSAPCTGPGNTGTGCHTPSSPTSTISSGTKIWGGTQYNANLVDDAYTQFTNLASYWNNQSATGTALPSQALSGNWNIQKTTSANGVYVFNAASGYAPTGSVTIGCGAAGNATAVNLSCNTNDMIVIIVPDGQTASILRNVTFASASGLRDDQLLFLIESTSSSALSLNGSGTNNNIVIHGDFFVANGGGYTVGNTKATTIDGRVFAGGGTGTQILTWNSGDTLNNEDPVPEPGTWVLMIGGLAGLVWFNRRRRRKAIA